MLFTIEEKYMGIQAEHGKFAYFACTHDDKGFVRRVQAETVGKEEKLTKHDCQGIIDSLMAVLGEHSRFKKLLQDTQIKFTFHMSPAEKQPGHDSRSVEAALVVAVINLLITNTNCNSYVFTGTVNGEFVVGKVNNIILKSIGVCETPNLKFAVPVANQAELMPFENLQHEKHVFIETVDDLLRIAGAPTAKLIY